MTYPDTLNGEVVTYTYDSGGSSPAAAAMTTASSRSDYDKFGERLLIDSDNGTRTTYDYNPFKTAA